MSTTTQQRRFPQQLVWLTLLIIGLALAGCASGDVELPSAAGVATQDEEGLSGARSLLEELQESGVMGAGSGVITVEGVDYSFEATTSCLSASDGFNASGFGQTADGVPYRATLSTSVSTPEEMLASGLPQANVDAFFGDKDSIEFFDLEIELGKADNFSPADDSMPNFRSSIVNVAESTEVSYTVDGSTLSGTAAVSDDNGVAFDYTERAEASFSATCT